MRKIKAGSVAEMSIENHYNETVDIYRYLLSDEWGATKEWILVHEAVPALVRLLSGRERIVDEGKQLIADYKIYHDVNDIGQTDRYVWNSEVYEVLEIQNPNQLDRHLQVKVKQLPPGTINQMSAES